MSKFTPGPWKWTAGWSMGPSEKDGTSCVQNDKGDLVFHSCDGCSLEPSEADANLIAAAPEMYEALKELLDATPQEECGPDCNEANCPWMQAKAALAEADGAL